MSRISEIEKSARRNIKSGLEYDDLFPAANGLDKVVYRDGNVKDTIKTMQKIVLKYLDDTKLIAPKLKGKNLEETCRNIWNFLYSHCQYKLDEAGLEQLRRPARAWHDRFQGIDCDCFSIFCSSILTNLDIPHSFRITKYTNENGTPGEWQHVYVIVPKEKSGHYTIDCVAHHFNYEKPFYDKIDYHMTQLNGIPIAVLSGLGATPDDELYGILSGEDFTALEGLGTTSEQKKAFDAIYNHLVSTRNYIEKNPKSVITSGGAAAHLQMLNDAIDNWNTANRDKALEILEQEEERWNNHNGVSGLSDEEEISGLGAVKTKKKFFGKVKEAVHNIGKKAGEELKKITKAIVKYNPLSLAVRGGFLLAMKINLLGMAGKIYPAYLTEMQAKSKGISSGNWQKAKSALAQIEKLFVDKLHGRADKLKHAITSGRATRQFKGFGELGEPATITSVVASAVPLISAYEEIRKAGLHGLGDDESNSTSTEGFIQLVKDWWKKTFGKEDVVAPETISDEDKEPNDKADTANAEQADGDHSSSASLPTALQKKSADNTPPQESGWSKFKTFAKENPGKVAVGAVAVAAVATGAVVGIKTAIKKSKEKKNSPKTSEGLSGHKKRRRRKNKQSKTIILK
jgi:hypothetical protein